MREDEWSYNVAIYRDYKHYNVYCVFSFYQEEYEYVLRLTPKLLNIRIVVTDVNAVSKVLEV